MNAYIRSVGAYIPEQVWTNDDLARTLDTSDEWIYSHTGIKNRHIAPDNETASDLGVKASRIAIERSGLDLKEIDMVIAATATPDYHGFPSTACIIQDKLGIPSTGAFDLRAACAGFIYSLEVARNFITSGMYKNILVVATEIMTRVLNWEDRNTAVLFGDGAGAIILSAGTEDDKKGIFQSFLVSEGSGAEFLKIRGGGTRYPYKLSGMTKDELYLYMDGRAVYNFAVRALVDVVKNLCSRSRIDINDISYIIPHQANIRIIQSAAKRLKIPLEKFYLNLEEYANTSAASIPMALNEMCEKGLLKGGELLLTAGFGGGLTYGGNLFYW
ncbi:MAG: ketoacyl-ACP synthase III [Spirochaetales bacterium]|nr:ketoacyl-ACP synthase III [Spirochaetales bacterium]